jgi:hypothetical protein
MGPPLSPPWASLETLVDERGVTAWETGAVTPRARLFVTLEGYAVEGGFDRPGGPATCYSPTIALGRHPGPGAADGLWRHYEDVLDLVPELGVAGVRLNVEWARVEPRADEVDESALRRYLDVVGHARSLGLDVTVGLVDAVWPSWLGQEAWLLPWVAPYAHAQIERITEELRRDDVVGAKVVAASTVVTLDAGPEGVLSARATFEGSEIYVRSLLAGSGPTRVGAGLVVHHGDQWRVSASEELLSALR